MSDGFENIGRKVEEVVSLNDELEGNEEEREKKITVLITSIRNFLNEAKDDNDRTLRENTLVSVIEGISVKSGISIAEIASLLFPEENGLLLSSQNTDSFLFERLNLLDMAQANPRYALEYADTYKDQPYAAEIVGAAADKAPWYALEYADKYKDQPYAAEVIEKAARAAADKDPWSALAYADTYKDQPYAAEIIGAAADKEPWYALKYADKYKDQPYAAEVIGKAARLSPVFAGVEFQRIKSFLENSKDPIVRDVHNLIGQVNAGGFSQDVLILAHFIINKKLSLQEALEVAETPGQFVKKLVELKNNPDAIGQYDVDSTLEDICLRMVRSINDLHNEDDSVRFESVANSSPEELYYIMTYGEEEIFTSSFNGFFDRMMERLKKDGQSGYDLLTKTSGNKFRIFIKLCAGYGRLGEFLNTMGEAQKMEVLERFVSNLEKNKEFLAEAVTVADTFASLNEPQLLFKIQAILKREYERVQKESNEKGVKIYGLLAGMFGVNAVVDEEWYAQIAEKYKMQNVSRLPVEDLFNPDGSNVQQHFFYGDKDGIASFKHFLETYRNKNGWRIEDKGKFVVITKQKGPKKVIIYANKPQDENDGMQEIGEELQKNKVERIVVVHRGHSYHTGKTIEAITPAASIVFLGSCGGYGNVSAVLGKSAEAHIIATKGTGTMSVNDPLLYSLNEKILTGKDIHWQSFWGETERVLGNLEDFHKYVPPHRNLGVLFLKTYARMGSR